jgi:hypothetical protein
MKLYPKLVYLSLILLLTLLSGFFFYGIVTPNTWSGYFQNVSLVPIGHRLLILIAIWSFITLPFLAKCKKFNLGFWCLAFFILFNLFLDGYYIIQLVSVSKNLNLAKQLVMSRYGSYQPIQTAVSKSIRLKNPTIEGSPDHRFFVKLDDDTNTFSVYDAKDNAQILAMEHWLVSLGDLVWLVNDHGQANYILYGWSYDRDDYDKIYITNLKTKKTVLLAKGRWLYG